MTPFTEFIILYQHREERTGRSPSGEPFYHTVVDFAPILHSDEEIFTYKTETPENALSYARKIFPHHLIAVQPLSEYLQCHQKPKPSQRSLRPSAQRPGS